MNARTIAQPVVRLVFPRDVAVARGALAITLALTAIATVYLASATNVGATVTQQAFVAQGVWVTTGKMNVPRADHTATLLRNGKVLVVGGHNTDALASAELYDPSTGTWSITGPLSGPRVGHSATLLPDGRVLIAGGGTNRTLTATAELYDPNTGSWTAAADMATPRGEHTATLLEDGRVLVAGGVGINPVKPLVDFFVKTSELYDPATGQWSATGDLNVARSDHSAARLPDGTVLIAKGTASGDFSFMFASAELYDPVSGTWLRVADSTWSSALHSAVVLSDGEVLFTGGYTGGVGGGDAIGLSELFDYHTRTWTRTLPPNTGRYSHTTTLMPDGSVLSVGGTIAVSRNNPGGYNFGAVTIASVEHFGSATPSWTFDSSLNAPRERHTATLLGDGRVLVAGGAVNAATCCSASTLDSAELYVSQLSPTPATARAIEYYGASSGDYFITTAPDEISSLDASAQQWERTGKSFLVWTAASPGLTPVCRFFNAQKNTHFFTPEGNECTALQSTADWLLEGEPFALQLPQGTPGQRNCPSNTEALYRLYNNGQSGVPNHRYSNDMLVVNEMRGLGWIIEGESQTALFACAARPSGTIVRATSK